MSRWLVRVLRGGVAAAAILVVCGLVLFVLGGDRGGPTSLDEALGKTAPVERVHPSAIVHDLRHGVAAAYIELGILVLVLTPTLRVAVTIVGFAREHDRIFALLAFAVLVILVFGLFGFGA